MKVACCVSCSYKSIPTGGYHAHCREMRIFRAALARQNIMSSMVRRGNSKIPPLIKVVSCFYNRASLPFVPSDECDARRHRIQTAPTKKKKKIQISPDSEQKLSCAQLNMTHTQGTPLFATELQDRKIGLCDGRSNRKVSVATILWLN